jgi:hypothetical protein
MSFTLTYRTLGNPNFLSGVKKLVMSDKWKKPKEAYNVARLGSLLEQELKTFFDLRGKFLTKVQSSKPEGEWTEEDKKKALELRQEADAFGDVSFVVERHKVDFASLDEISLTPAEILALEPLLDNLPS